MGKRGRKSVLSEEELRGVRRYISKKLIEIDGKAFIEEIYEVDHGPKLGITKVRVLDPCVTEEAQQKRRDAIVQTCKDAIRKGHVLLP